MASQELKKYRSVKNEDIINIFPGDTLYFDDGRGSFTVEVVSACKEDCMILVNGEKVTVSWDKLQVLA
jgi:hypothetical protein